MLSLSHTLVTWRAQRMGIVPVAFALKLTHSNRVGLAVPEASPSPPSSRADGAAGRTFAEQQQVSPHRLNSGGDALAIPSFCINPL